MRYFVKNNQLTLFIKKTMMVIAGPGVTCAVIGLAWGKGTPFAITPLAVAAVTAKQTTSIISVVLEVVHHTNLVTNL
jgi:hypothetical protein|tara:strand:- start:380 stop:610 length:231 start_codon:yes stop_codon:yes gene_type:complete